MELKMCSFGGDVQSTAALMLVLQGKIDYRAFLFCDVGDDSENPETLTSMREIAMPCAARHGLELIELHKVRRDGTVCPTVHQVVGPVRSISRYGVDRWLKRRLKMVVPTVVGYFVCSYCRERVRHTGEYQAC